MPSGDTFEEVRKIVEASYNDPMVFGPSTDIASIAVQMDDPELLEFAIDAIEHQFGVKTPRVVDDRGRSRRPVLQLPSKLLLSDLVAIVESGEWPTSWIIPGRFMPRILDRG